MSEIQKLCGTWQSGAYSSAGSKMELDTMMSKLREETEEAMVEFDQNKLKVELADIGIVIYAISFLMGWDLDSEIRKKIEINSKREWYVLPDGRIKHK